MKLVENPQVTQMTFTCFESTGETPEQCVKPIQSSEAHLNLP